MTALLLPSPDGTVECYSTGPALPYPLRHSGNTVRTVYAAATFGVSA